MRRQLHKHLLIPRLRRWRPPKPEAQAQLLGHVIARRLRKRRQRITAGPIRRIDQQPRHPRRHRDRLLHIDDLFPVIAPRPAHPVHIQVNVVDRHLQRLLHQAEVRIHIAQVVRPQLDQPHALPLARNRHPRCIRRPHITAQKLPIRPRSRRKPLHRCIHTRRPRASPLDRLHPAGIQHRLRQLARAQPHYAQQRHRAVRRWLHVRRVVDAAIRRRLHLLHLHAKHPVHLRRRPSHAHQLPVLKRPHHRKARGLRKLLHLLVLRRRRPKAIHKLLPRKILVKLRARRVLLLLQQHLQLGNVPQRQRQAKLQHLPRRHCAHRGVARRRGQRRRDHPSRRRLRVCGKTQRGRQNNTGNQRTGECGRKAQTESP